MAITEKELTTYFQNKFSDLKDNSIGGQIPEIKELREKALEQFSQLGFPMKKSEEYKYTPITKSLMKSMKLESDIPSEATMLPPFGEHLMPSLDGFLLVYWNGRLAFKSEELPKGLTVEQFDELDSNHQDKILNYVASLSELNTDAFASLNTAFLNRGSVISIPDGVEIDRPIIIYHIFDGHTGGYFQTRHLIIAGKNSQATILEINKNTNSELEVFQNAVTEVFLEESAKLHLHKLQTECDGALIVDNTSISQQEKSYLNCNTITTSGRMIRNNLNISINGQYCEAHMHGLYLLHGKDHVDNHTKVDHRMANSFSNELYKGIIDDSATGVFNGKIYVQPDAQKTNAFQSNKNILLSNKANMNTKPQLEIWADDVKCSHGATTGQLDEDQIFYLRARGLDEQQAKGLLLYAFAKESLENINLPEVQQHLELIISERLYHKKS